MSRDRTYIAFGEKFVHSSTFHDLFQEGMILVREVASYLQRRDYPHSQELTRSHSIIFTTETIRLAGRLMHIAAWLLLHQEVRAKNITWQDAQHDSIRTCLYKKYTTPDLSTLRLLPAPLGAYIDRAHRIHVRLLRWDQCFYAHTTPSEVKDSARARLERLRIAFEGKDTFIASPSQAQCG